MQVFLNFIDNAAYKMYNVNNKLYFGENDESSFDYRWLKRNRQ